MGSVPFGSARCGLIFFPPGEQISFFGPWADDGNTSCNKFLENGNLLAFEVLKAQCGGFPMDFWPYRQLHFFAQHGHAIRDISSLTPFKRLFIAEEPIPHMRLLTHQYQLTHSSSLDSKMQEINYKILSRWYRVPADLSCIYLYPCWRGCGHKGTLLHLWWECPVIEPF